MRTIIDLPDAQIEALRRLEQRDNVSRAELIRQAVADYVSKRVEHADAFGAWKARKVKVDGVEYQRKIRDEWERK